MEDDQIPTGKVSDWQPITNKVDLAYLGKTGEELGKLIAAIFRCIIQGIAEKEPVTGKPNKQWLEDEVADVQMMLHQMIQHFDLDQYRITERRQLKYTFKQRWFDALKVQATLAKSDALFNAKPRVQMQMQECSNWLRDHGKPSPRTCAICGLGPCRSGIHGAATPTQEKEALPASEVMRSAVSTATDVIRSAVSAVITAVQKEQMDSEAAVEVMMALILSMHEV